MDGYQEKKWFVYLGDHHEGPFSVDEIEGKMSSGELSRSTYVWAEGMSDWEPMTDVSAFISVVGDQDPSRLGVTESIDQASASAGASATASEISTAPSSKSSGSFELEQGSPMPASIAVEETPRKANPFQAVELDSGADKILNPATRPQKQVEIVGVSTVSPIPGMIKSLVIWAIIGYGAYTAYEQGYVRKVTEHPVFKGAMRITHDLSRPFLVKLSESFPIAKRWISPIPYFEDVSSSDYSDLKTAASAPPELGPLVSIAASTADTSSPSFYVASNLPDGAWMELYIEGIPDTLLNQIQFTAKAQIQIQKKYGKSQPIRYSDGKQIPRGQYLIYVTESDFQEPPVKNVLHNARLANFQSLHSLPRGRVFGMIPRSAKIIAGKTYFLGGAKDDTYHTRLKEFHDKLKARANKELGELKMFSTEIEGQLNRSNMKFVGLKRPKLSPQARNSWKMFHSSWSLLDQNLKKSFERWTPSILENEYFYGYLYSWTRQTYDTIERVHALQNQYFSGPVDKRSFDIQLGQAVSSAKDAISKLKAKIEVHRKLPPTPNGMPRREGL